MISENYIRILFIYHTFNEYDISSSNIRHSMLVFCKKNNNLIYNGLQ